MPYVGFQWHLGFFADEYTPLQRGFDSHYGYYMGAEDYWAHIAGSASKVRHTHTRTHAHTHMHAHTRAHTHMHACTHAHTCMHTRAHTQTHACTHTHICTHTHTHTHTHTYTALNTFPHLFSADWLICMMQYKVMGGVTMATTRGLYNL